MNPAARLPARASLPAPYFTKKYARVIALPSVGPVRSPVETKGRRHQYATHATTAHLGRCQCGNKSQASKGTPSKRLPVRHALMLPGTIPLAPGWKTITKAGWAPCSTFSSSILCDPALPGPKRRLVRSTCSALRKGALHKITCRFEPDGRIEIRARRCPQTCRLIRAEDGDLKGPSNLPTLEKTRSRPGGSEGVARLDQVEPDLVSAKTPNSIGLPPGTDHLRSLKSICQVGNP